MRKIINTLNAPEPLGPYSQAILVDQTLYVSGQIAIEPSSKQLINSDIKSETTQVIKNMTAIIEEAGLSLSNVVKCSIFIKEMNDFTKINHVYEQYFNEVQPARETVEVSRLPKDVNIEISCIAVK